MTHECGEQIGLRAIGGGDFFEQEFNGLADVFTQHAGKIGLPLAGFLDGIEQTGDTFLDWLQRFRRQQLPQAAEFLGALAVIEPAFALPLAPGLEIEARIDEAKLLSTCAQNQPPTCA
jgi:hypothetical protein